MAERFRIYCPPCLFRSLPCVQPTDPGLMPADWMEQQLAYLDPTLKRSLGLKTGDDLRRRIKAMAVQVRGRGGLGATVTGPAGQAARVMDAGEWPAPTVYITHDHVCGLLAS